MENKRRTAIEFVKKRLGPEAFKFWTERVLEDGWGVAEEEFRKIYSLTSHLAYAHQISAEEFDQFKTMIDELNKEE